MHGKIILNAKKALNSMSKHFQGMTYFFLLIYDLA